MRGDALIAEPLASMTNAITIHRPARDVWPWLAQMGAGTFIMQRRQLLGIARRAESTVPRDSVTAAHPPEAAKNAA